MRAAYGLKNMYADWRLNTEENIIDAMRRGEEVLREDTVIWYSVGQMVPSPLLGNRVGFIDMANRLEDAKIQFIRAEGLRGKLTQMAQTTTESVSVMLKGVSDLPRVEPVQVSLARRLSWERNGDLVYRETPGVMFRRGASFQTTAFRHNDVVIGNRPRSFFARCVLALKGY